MISIVLFSDDFRIEDNPALYNASLQSSKIIPVYIYNEDYVGRKIGAASKVFLFSVLNSFSNLLKEEYGCNLIIRKGAKIEELKNITKETGAKKIFFNKSYTAKEVALEDEMKGNFECESFKAKVIFDPTEIREIKVFTPFWKECLRHSEVVRAVLPKPNHIKAFEGLKSLKIEDLNLLPKQKWATDLLQCWEFNYHKINNNLKYFIKNKLKNYKDERNIPSLNSTSKLSAYIRFGVISVNSIFHEVVGKSDFFASELGWREFAFSSMFRMHKTLLHVKQNLWEEELKPEFKNFKFDANSHFLEKWQKGETGEPLVDAGMKELWYTGYMHNRVRMIAASFLIKDLLINWKNGEAWFWDTLCDACPAVNPFSWQWVFGSGYDASPFFRIFNPSLQMEKFDPESKYINKWNNKTCIPLVNHEESRKLALIRYKSIKENI